MATFGEIRSAAGTQSKDEFVDALIAALPPIYQKEDKNTILAKLYSALAEQLVKADIILETVANNNYLTVSVTDELQIRSSGSHDRLKNENAFELTQIRLTPPNTIMTQNAFLQEGLNDIQLYFIPEDVTEIIVYDSRDSNQAPLNFPITFNSDINTLTVLATSSGPYTISYKDTGDVVRLSENVIVPEGLFLLGYDLGGYDQLGYGE